MAPVVVAVATSVVALLIISALEQTSVADRTLREDAVYHRALRFALLQAGAATGSGLILGLPLSWLLSRGTGPLRWTLTFLVVAPFAIPSITLGLGIELLAPSEVQAGVLVAGAHAIGATAIVAWIVTPAWRSGDPAATEAARLLGAGRLSAYLAGAGRDLISAVRAALALAFFHAFISLGAVFVLYPAGTSEYLVVFGWTGGENQPAASEAARATVALVQVAIGLLVLAIGGINWPRAAVPRPRTSRWIALASVAYAGFLAVLLWAPLVAVVREAAMHDGFDRLSDTALGQHDAWFLLQWTVILGVLAALVAVVLAWPASRALAHPAASRWSRGLRWLVAVPVGLTAASVGWSGVLLAEHVGLDLDRTYALTVCAHALVAYPFALRILGSQRSDGQPLIEAARLLGVGLRRARWRWRGRRTAMAVASAALVSMVLSAGELGAAWLLTPANATPAGVGILHSVAVTGGGGSPVEVVAPPAAYAVAAILSVATVIAFACAEWLRRNAARGGEMTSP